MGVGKRTICLSDGSSTFTLTLSLKATLLLCRLLQAKRARGKESSLDDHEAKKNRHSEINVFRRKKKPLTKNSPLISVQTMLRIKRPPTGEFKLTLYYKAN